MNDIDVSFLELYVTSPRRILPVFPIATIHTYKKDGLEYTVINDNNLYRGEVVHEETISRVSADAVLQATQGIASRNKHNGPLDVAYTHSEEGTTIRFLQRTSIKPYYRTN